MFLGFALFERGKAVPNTYSLRVDGAAPIKQVLERMGERPDEKFAQRHYPHCFPQLFHTRVIPVRLDSIGHVDYHIEIGHVDGACRMTRDRLQNFTWYLRIGACQRRSGNWTV